MSKIDKKLKKWENGKQEESLETVIAVIEKKIPGCLKVKSTRGSHNYFIYHECLTAYPEDYGALGEMHFPVKGKKVKPIYLKKIVKVIKLIEEYDG